MGSISLCMPFYDTSCFRCCPPIRPAGYDHLDFVSSLKREFRENRDRMLSGKSFNKPVMGFWCWALGYLDPHLKTIGCLLHPARHEGVDLRSLTGYGAKCARELCYEARQFEKLADETKVFWLELVRGLNSFYFSSPRANPIFHLLRWGPAILELVRFWSERKSWSATEAVWHLGFLLRADLEPRAWRLAVEIALEQVEDPEDMAWDEFFHAIQSSLKGISPAVFSRSGDEPYVHELDVSESLKDFVRFFFGISRMDVSPVKELGAMLRQIVLDVQHKR